MFESRLALHISFSSSNLTRIMSLEQILTGAAGLLDHCKAEWGSEWSAYDQSIRDGITHQLTKLEAVSQRFTAHPEDFCDSCGGPNITWFANNAIWNRITNSGSGILCPVCFVKLAATLGYGSTAWELKPEYLLPEDQCAGISVHRVPCPYEHGGACTCQ